MRVCKGANADRVGNDIGKQVSHPIYLAKMRGGWHIPHRASVQHFKFQATQSPRKSLMHDAGDEVTTW